MLVTAVIFYIFYDLISTIAAYQYLGTFDYEQSFLIKAIYDSSGIPGFIFVKILLSSIAIYAAYLIMERSAQFRGFGIGILIGATLAGLFVGTSNLNIILTGGSFWVFGLDSGTIAILLLVGCAAMGFFIKGSDTRTQSA